MVLRKKNAVYVQYSTNAEDLRQKLPLHFILSHQNYCNVCGNQSLKNVNSVTLPGLVEVA